METPKLLRSEIIKLQEIGKTRQEIAQHFDVSDQEMKKYFVILKIKSKAKKKLKYQPIDDTIEVPAITREEQVV